MSREIFCPVSRGARRRSGRGGKRRAGAKRPQSGTAEGDLQNPQARTASKDSSGRSRRRRRGGQAGGMGSIIDTMAARTGVVQTLPPDGTVLEELIADLEAEYGTPATPQEYRLIIKVASGEEPGPPVEEPAKRQEDETGRPQGPRRRRRGRRQSRRKTQPVAQNETTV